MNKFEYIKSIVAKIPKGKVSTYGEIANKAGINNPRVVGWAIRNNQDKNVPCHRVLMKDGSLAKNFSLGGWIEQKIRLEEDGVKFEKFSENEVPKVDMEKYRWI